MFAVTAVLFFCMYVIFLTLYRFCTLVSTGPIFWTEAILLDICKKLTGFRLFRIRWSMRRRPKLSLKRLENISFKVWTKSWMWSSPVVYLVLIRELRKLTGAYIWGQYKRWVSLEYHKTTLYLNFAIVISLIFLLFLK